ncbi:MAG: hypothetical protein F4018_01655 [Acidobacteria bacterium]|nr:hypothetical protein [Acidobacteriota bacterium]MYK87143.1 hypothetical protein [Acidobacteriota bacterium]
MFRRSSSSLPTSRSRTPWKTSSAGWRRTCDPSTTMQPMRSARTWCWSSCPERSSTRIASRPTIGKPVDTIRWGRVLAPFRYFEQRRADLPYRVLSLLPTFREARDFPLYFRDDPHWNAAGARVAARGIADYLVREGAVPCGS